MSDQYFNPFAGIDINIPNEFHETFTQYSQRGADLDIDEVPFPRMVDLWFLSLCVACRLGLEPIDTTRSKTTKIIDGSIFSSDPWRVDVLMLIAIAKTNDVQIVSEPRRIMSLTNSLAVAGLPRVIEMLKDGKADPIWNLSDALDSFVSDEKTVQRVLGA